MTGLYAYLLCKFIFEEIQYITIYTMYLNLKKMSIYLYSKLTSTILCANRSNMKYLYQHGSLVTDDGVEYSMPGA